MAVNWADVARWEIHRANRLCTEIKKLMTNAPQLNKIIIYCLILPFVVLIGFVVAQTDSFMSQLILAAVLMIGSLPLLMKWHHSLLILSWNAAVQAFFLPGQPGLWIVLVFVSLFFSIWQRSVSGKTSFISVPFLTWPLVILALIIIITAFARGGIGLRSFGSSTIGARRYLTTIAAILGYFALSYQAIPKRRAIFYGSLFFLSGISAAVCDVLYAAGPGFYWLFYVFPPELARAQAAADYMGPDAVFRTEGVAWASVAFYCFMLAKYGIRGVLDWHRPWRLILLLLVIVAGLFGGFRSRLIVVGLFFLIQFYLEGLWRTWLLPVLLGVGITILGAILPFMDKLPPAVQRSLSFLPGNIDPSVRTDADGTMRWRLEMWQMLLPEIPEYFWLGKGYTFSASDQYLTSQLEVRGLAKNYEMMALVGEYHNGLLSLILPFGIFGTIAFIWLLVAGWWALFRNYRYGDPELRRINTFLLTFYTGRCLFFFLIYGSLHLELALFTGTAGLSVALNNGVKRKSRAVPTEPAQVSQAVSV
jgi:hypothetical protein